MNHSKVTDRMVEAAMDAWLKCPDFSSGTYNAMRAAIEAALRAALAEPVQEPVAYRWKAVIDGDRISNWVLTHSEPPPYAVAHEPLYAQSGPQSGHSRDLPVTPADGQDYGHLAGDKPAPTEPAPEPVAVVRSVVGQGDEGVRIKWLGGFPQIGDRLYTAPPKAEPVQEYASIPGTNVRVRIARAIERAHGIGGKE